MTYTPVMETEIRNRLDRARARVVASRMGQGRTWAGLAERWARVEAILAMALDFASQGDLQAARAWLNYAE